MDPCTSSHLIINIITVEVTKQGIRAAAITVGMKEGTVVEATMEEAVGEVAFDDVSTVQQGMLPFVTVSDSGFEEILSYCGEKNVSKLYKKSFPSVWHLDSAIEPGPLLQC